MCKTPLPYHINDSKAKYKDIKTKKENPNTPHKDVMAKLVAKYNELKISK